MGRLRNFHWRSRWFPRKLSFTREGKVVVLVSIGLGLAAVNTGNNLLYLVFGLSLALIVISGILSEGNLRGLACRPLPSVRAEAGVATFAVLGVDSRRGRYPAFSIEAWPFFDDPSVTVDPARLLELEPGRAGVAVCRLSFARRGEYPVRGMVLSTSFPFSFFRKSVVVPSEATVTVHPRVRPVQAPPVDPLASGEDASRPVPGRGLEFFGARDFREGDNPRHILHRLTASRTVPVVRELEEPATRRCWIALPNAVRPGGEAAMEEAIEVAASLAVQRLGLGEVVGLATASGAVSPGTGSVQVRRVLDFLATVPVLHGAGPVDDRVRHAGGWTDEREVLWVRLPADARPPADDEALR